MSTSRLAFAVLPTPAVVAEAPCPSPCAAGAAPDPRRKSVLLVDDDAAVRRAVARLLARHGFEVFAFASGFDALDLVRREDVSVDVLVTDVVMPGIDGLALAAELRKRRPGTGCVFMSGYDRRDLLPVGQLPALEPVLTKPFMPDALVAAVVASIRPVTERPLDGVGDDT